ncbi:MAG: ATP-dependent DNA helicase [Candidatus Hydrothermarchaeota archaeon]
MDLFPYEPRRYQVEIMELISSTLKNGGNLILESGTGTGKTICALAPCLEYAIENEKVIVYVTRTNSQQKQVIDELKAIIEKKNAEITSIAFQGRKHMCLLFKDITLGSEELSRLCKKRKKDHTCEFYENMQDTIKDDLSKKLRCFTAEELVETCQNLKICPYEMNKILAPNARVVVGPYHYMFDPSIRKLLLKWTEKRISDIILIVDEAHNLPDFARNLLSRRLSIWGIRRALNESKGLEEPLYGEITHDEFFNHLGDVMHEFEEDEILLKNEYENIFCETLGISLEELLEISEILVSEGEYIKDAKEERGDPPISYIYSIGSFIQDWLLVNREDFIKMYRKDEYPVLEINCLDASLSTKDVFEKVFSSISMSGTLTPLIAYRDLVGLNEDSVMKSFPSPFPPENRKIIYSLNVTTRFKDLRKNPNLYRLLAKNIRDACNSVPGNIIVFFPSFELMNRLMSYKIFDEIEKRIYIEEQGLSQIELVKLIEDFKENKNSVLLAVMGGRISEGLDFPGEELICTIIVGIPYPRPTISQQALERYLNRKFNGRGFLYAYTTPAIQRLLQSAGRLIRSDEDRGIVVILDKRVRNLRTHLPEWFMISPARDIGYEIRKFFV